MAYHTRGSGKALNPRKLLLISTASNIGGMERIICGLAREFTAREWQVQTVFPPAPNGDALLEWCRQQGVVAEINPAIMDAAMHHSRQGMINLANFIRSTSPDVVNVHYGDNFISLKDMIAVRMARMHKPFRTIITVNHPTPWNQENAKKKVMTRLGAHLADEVVAISTATRDVLLEAGVPAKKVRLVACGLLEPQHLISAAEARKRLGLPASAFIVGCLGRLVPHKGIADLIEAAALAKKQSGNTDMIVAIAGDGPERTALENLARERFEHTENGDKVVFLGRVPDVNEFYAACDVFALPSFLEGFGLVYVEAAFHGVPSIGTNVGGVVDVITDGETGLLVPPQNPSALAIAILRLRDDPMFRRVLGNAARDRAYSQFTEKSMADRYGSLFT